MKVLTLLFLFAIVALVGCHHMFVGTSIRRPVLFVRNTEFAAIPRTKRVQNLFYVMPKVARDIGVNIKGILAYDLTHSGARVNVTKGGIGANFVNLRMESDEDKKLNYEICIYA